MYTFQGNVGWTLPRATRDERPGAEVCGRRARLTLMKSATREMTGGSLIRRAEGTGNYCADPEIGPLACTQSVPVLGPVLGIPFTALFLFLQCCCC